MSARGGSARAGSPAAVRTGRRYRAARLQGRYDAIVIGSGIGGLTTAACLARLGQRVAVFEQHYTAGGFTHSYCRHGYEWDVGVHYIGDMGQAGTMGRRLFDYISDGSLQWAPMDPAFDRIYLGERQFELVAGRPAYRDQLVAQFPGEAAAIDEYLRRMRAVKSWFRLLAVEKLLPGAAASLARRQRQRRQPPWMSMTTRAVLEELTDDQTLIAVLAGQWGDYGLPPARSSFVMHSMVALHYLHGGYYPVGGAWRIAASIIPVIRSSGGEVFTYAAVEEILLRRGRAAGVRLADGVCVEAARVISDAGAINTFGQLLPPAQRPRYRSRLQQVERSMASMCLYIGLRQDAQTLGLPRCNLWIYPSEHFEADIARFDASPEAPLPLVYISFPSAKDPDFARRHPGRATIEIVAPGPYPWFSAWEDAPWGRRGADYEALKEGLSRRLLECLFAKLPQLRGQIDYCELSTALSTAHFCRHGRGEIYGLNHDPARFEQRWLRPATDIPGLYLSGQDVMTCGVMGAMAGGVLAAVAAGGVGALRLARLLS